MRSEDSTAGGGGNESLFVAAQPAAAITNDRAPARKKDTEGMPIFERLSLPRMLAKPQCDSAAASRRLDAKFGAR
jgi:hypothetical protein